MIERTPAVLGVLRIFTGVLWLANLGWKLPPDFGRDDPRGLMYSFELARDHAIPPIDRLVADVVIPHFTAFGWLVFAIELVAGILLLTGWHTRIGAVIGLAQSLAITSMVAFAPDEWRWGYAMLVMIHVVLLTTAAGTRFGLDGRR